MKRNGFSLWISLLVGYGSAVFGLTQERLTDQIGERFGISHNNMSPVGSLYYNDERYLSFLRDFITEAEAQELPKLYIPRIGNASLWIMVDRESANFRDDFSYDPLTARMKVGDRSAKRLVSELKWRLLPLESEKAREAHIRHLAVRKAIDDYVQKILSKKYVRGVRSSAFVPDHCDACGGSIVISFVSYSSEELLLQGLVELEAESSDLIDYSYFDVVTAGNGYKRGWKLYPYNRHGSQGKARTEAVIRRYVRSSEVAQNVP